MGRKGRSAVQPLDTYAYWLMPHGLRGFLTTVFWPATAARGTTGRARKEASRVDVGPAAARRRYPGPRRPFPILAPGKTGREAPAKARREQRRARVLARVALGPDRCPPG